MWSSAELLNIPTHIMGTSLHRLLVWSLGLGTSMTRDMSGFHDYSKPFLEFLNAEAFE